MINLSTKVVFKKKWIIEVKNAKIGYMTKTIDSRAKCRFNDPH